MSDWVRDVLAAFSVAAVAAAAGEVIAAVTDADQTSVTAAIVAGLVFALLRFERARRMETR